MTTDITELAQRMKAAAVRAKTATEEYASGHMSVSVCYAECEEFNRLTDGPDNILVLVEALEKSEKTSEGRREAIDITHKRAARERNRANAAVEALEKAQQRITQLESRTVTVNLASRRLPSDYADGEFGNDDLAAIHNACLLECKVSVEKYLSAHGIVVKWEAE